MAMKKRPRKDNGKKARLISNVYSIEITKMRDSGMSYAEIAKKLSFKHRRHFSVGWVWKNYKGAENRSKNP